MLEVPVLPAAEATQVDKTQPAAPANQHSGGANVRLLQATPPTLRRSFWPRSITMLSLCSIGCLEIFADAEYNTTMNDTSEDMDRAGEKLGGQHKYFPLPSFTSSQPYS